MPGETMFHELNEDLWSASDKICEGCRTKRSNFGCLGKEREKEWKKEKAKVNFFCPPYLGFLKSIDSDENSFSRKSVFFILESMGGGRPWRRKKDITFEEPMEELKQYYLSKPIERFHQYCIREILREMQERSIPFFVTDVVKCFVIRSNHKNFTRAADICSESYLKKQIFTLKPKVIVVFGGVARDALKRFATSQTRSKFAALNTENHSRRVDVELADRGQRHEASLIYSIFPTANRNADDWVRLQAKEKLLKAMLEATSAGEKRPQ